MAIVKSLAASSVRPWLRFSKNNQTVTGIEVCSRRAIPAFCATCRGTSVVPRVLVLTHRHLHKSPCDRRPFAEISGSISFSPLWFLSRKLCPIFVCQFKGSLQTNKGSRDSGAVCTRQQDLFQVEMTRSLKGPSRWDDVSSFSLTNRSKLMKRPTQYPC